MVVGMLFSNQDEARMAGKLADSLNKAGMFSVLKHATLHRKYAWEIEIRQDLAVQRAFRQRLIKLLEACLLGLQKRP